MHILRSRSSFFIILASLLLACNEFIEPSIADNKIILLAPSDRVETKNYNQTFWWEPVEDALQYRLQIVSPNFDTVAQLVLDTLIDKNQFSFVLGPGAYEWQVRAENGSSATLYTKHKLIIIEASIKNQQVQLKGPAADFLTNKAEITYQWEALPGSSQYRFQIDTNAFKDADRIVGEKVVQNESFTNLFPKEGTFQWRVRGENDSTQSRWSMTRTITFDKTPPSKVLLTSPGKDQTVMKPVKLLWESLPGAKKYELAVFKSDSTSLYNASFPLTLTNNTYELAEGTLNEKIYWKVRAIDEAGNVGLYSELRSFFVQ